jgi:hypothetical protein
LALAALTMVWLGATPPDAAATSMLDRFARDRNVTLEAPRGEEAAPAADAWALVERCETRLEEARDQLQAGDEDAAQRIVAEIDRTLRQHPELIPAAWLMAQRYRVEAMVARRTSPDRALRLERLAEATEGARTPAFAEPSAPPVAIAPIRIELVVHGARKREVYWDGAPTSATFSTTPGEHHLLVFRGDRVAWSGWVNALAAGKVDVWVADAAPCSAGDLDGVAMSAGRLAVPAGVRCGSWVVASPGTAPGTLSIALCNGDRCEKAEVFSDRLAATSPSEDRGASQAGFPSWIAWSLAGVGAAAATSIVLWQTGAFDRAQEPRVFYDGGRL